MWLQSFCVHVILLSYLQSSVHFCLKICRTLHVCLAWKKSVPRGLLIHFIRRLTGCWKPFIYLSSCPAICVKPSVLVFFWETTYARSFKFCMTIAAIELYTFITVLGTLAGCQGHIGVSERWHWQIPWFCFLETIAERALLFTLSVSCQFDDNDPFWRSHFQDNFLYNAPTFHGPPQPLCKSMDECETIKASPYKIYYT